MVVPRAGGEAGRAAVSFLANFNGDSLAWAPDGTFLLFATGQRTEPGQVARVDLVLRTPKFREDQFREPVRTGNARSRNPRRAPASEPPACSRPPRRAAPTPVASCSTNLRQRLSLAPGRGRRPGSAHQPRRQVLLLTAAAAGPDQPLRLFARRAGARARGRAPAHVDGRATRRARSSRRTARRSTISTPAAPQSITVEERRARALDVTAELDVDFSREKTAVFQQAWRFLNDYFFDARHNGADWAACATTYGARVQQARDAGRDAPRRSQLMIGELNASHLGVSAPPAAGDAAVHRTARRAVRSRRNTRRTGRLRIAEIMPLGPAAVASGIAVGDVIVCRRRPAGRRAATNLDELLQYTIGKRVVLGVQRPAPPIARSRCAR